MSNLLTPRPFQQKVMDKLAVCNSKRICVTAPTGAGKAIQLMMIANEALNKSQRVLLLVDRIALITQLSNTAKQCGLEHSIWWKCEEKHSEQFIIGSMQTVFYNGKIPGKYDLILIDECHQLYDGIVDYAATYKGTIIGVTATPFTIGLGNVYDTLITATTAHELTENGTLCALEPYIMTKINMEDTNYIGGEYSARAIRARSADILGDVVANYKQHALGLRSICFCATIQHCDDVAKQFTDAGIPIAVYTSKTSLAEREQILKDFDNSKVMILISVAALSKGFDKPYIECILDLRPLRRSFAEYVQMIGRGLRSMPGKKACKLLDFSGNLHRFIDDYEDLFHNGVKDLNQDKKLNRIRHDKPFNKICPGCDFVSSNHTCVKCGYEKPIKTRHITCDTSEVVIKPVTRLKAYRDLQARVEKLRAKVNKPSMVKRIFSSIF